ncbi:hypothetical protein KBC03_08440, partial [Patescibacteria group bacterium]|nr:hypothetical protein [Patescibacteria group bacterium]
MSGNKKDNGFSKVKVHILVSSDFYEKIFERNAHLIKKSQPGQKRKITSSHPVNCNKKTGKKKK